MKKYQILGHTLIPSTISFLLMLMYTIVQKIGSQGTNSYITLGLAFAFLVILIRWCQKKEVLPLYIGFKHLKHEIWFPLYMGYSLLLLWGYKLFQPNLYKDINSVYLMGFLLLFYIIATYIRKKVLIESTFIRITSEHYFDLTYFEIHTREELEQYEGVKTLQEDLFIENLLLIEKHCKHKSGKEIKVTIEETFEGIVLTYTKDEKEYTSVYQKKELSEGEKQRVTSIIKRIAI